MGGGRSVCRWKLSHPTTGAEGRWKLQNQEIWGDGGVGWGGGLVCNQGGRVGMGEASWAGGRSPRVWWWWSRCCWVL